MGKRELLLVVAFVIAGAIVYQATAPPPAPGERTFSIGQIIDHLRRGVRGNRASAEVTNHSTHPVDAGVTELRLTLGGSDNIKIAGEDRADIDAELRVRSTGYDDAEAQRLARESLLKVDRAGGRLVMSVDFPEAGSQRASIILKIPAHMTVKLEATRGELVITQVAAVELSNVRGQAQIRKVSGRVSGAHRGGELLIADSGSVRVATIGSDVQLEQIRADVNLNMRGGQLKGSELGGPIDIDAANAEIVLERLEKTTGILRINAVAGSVSVKGMRTEGRIDVRNAQVDVTVERAAPLAIYSEGGGRVEITPPPGGYQLDAVATDAHITIPEGTLKVATNGPEQRATGAVGGGGPMITIRTTHGSITVRAR